MKSICQIIIVAVLFAECNSQKKMSAVPIGVNDPFSIAIEDYAKTDKRFKRDSVFLVKQYSIERDTNLVVIGIATSYNKIYISKDLTVGNKGQMPSRFVEREGKLFYWWDNNLAVTDEVFKEFEKFRLIVRSDNSNVERMSNFRSDDSQKAAHYYFCKRNLLKYKKVITSIGVGYYDPPLLNCIGN